MTDIEKLIEVKNDLGNERDLCAELYNVWITRLHDYQDIPEKYNMYMKMISIMEPYTNSLKEQMREINRKICDIEGVDSIGDTKYVRECVNKYGVDRPNEY